MSKIEIVLNTAGVGELLRSEEIDAATKEVAEYVAQKCGSGYITDRHMMPTRAVYGVIADTREASKDNLENNTLLKALYD